MATNPLMGVLGGGNAMLGCNSMPQGIGNFMGFVQKFNQFKQNFQGNPKAEVERLLQTGQMSQAQYNQLAGFASQLQQLM